MVKLALPLRQTSLSLLSAAIQLLQIGGLPSYLLSCLPSCLPPFSSAGRPVSPAVPSLASASPLWPLHPNPAAPRVTQMLHPAVALTHCPAGWTCPLCAQDRCLGRRHSPGQPGRTLASGTLPLEHAGLREFFSTVPRTTDPGLEG